MLTKHLTGLVQLRSIQAQISRLVDGFAASGSSLSTLDEYGSPGALPKQHPNLVTIATLANQLQALCLGERFALTKSLDFHVSSSLRVAMEARVAETLREAGRPLSAVEIAKSSSIEPNQLTQVLRLLAANHIFRETKPGVFDRNIGSSALDTGKSLRSIEENPSDIYSDAGALAAMMLVFTDEGFKASSLAAEQVLSKKTDQSEQTTTAFSRSHSGYSFYDYFAREGNEERRIRFANAMRGLPQLQSSDGETILKGFPWSELPKGSTVVDVAGGMGQVSLAIAEAAPLLNFVVQDRQEVIEGDASHFWKSSTSPEVQTRVQLQPHDIFATQPIKGASAYFLRYIIHNWPESACTAILQRLADAASPESKLVLIEVAIDELSPPHRFPTSTLSYLLDVQMMVFFNAQERTERQYRELGRKAGWELIKTWKTGKGGQDGPFRHYEFARMSKK